MAFYIHKIDVPNVDSSGNATVTYGTPECLIVGIGVVIHDTSGLGTSTELKIESQLPGTTTRTTLYDKVIGHTNQPVKALSGQFIDSSGTAVTSNVWYPPHVGELILTISSATGPSVAGLTVLLMVQM